METKNEECGRSVEEALLHELRFSKIDKDNLSELVGIAAGLQKGGLETMKVFPKGIINPDGIRVSGIMDASQFAKLFEIISATPRTIGRVVGFPYGVLAIDKIKVDIDIGASSEVGQVSRF